MTTNQNNTWTREQENQLLQEIKEQLQNHATQIKQHTTTYLQLQLKELSKELSKKFTPADTTPTPQQITQTYLLASKYNQTEKELQTRTTPTHTTIMPKM